MMYGRVLRAPKYRAKMLSVDMSAAAMMEGVIPVIDGEFVGVAATTAYAAQTLIEAIGKTAKWSDVELPTTGELYDYLRANVTGGVPANPFAADVAKATKS